MSKINIAQAIADLEHKKDIEVIEYKHNMEYIENKIELLEAVDTVQDAVLDYLEYLQEQPSSEDYGYIENMGSGPSEDFEYTENKGSGPSEDYENIEIIGSGASTNTDIDDMNDDQYMDEKCKETNVFFMFYNIFRNYIYIPILNIWNS